MNLKIIILALFALGVGSSSFAQPVYPAYGYGAPPPMVYYHPYESAGCGLGSIWIHSDGTPQWFAATTNHSFSSQSFGISSGTSNCGHPGGYATLDAEKQLYVETNRDAITQEMAQGSGEHLVALASLMGCEKDVSASFGAVMKKNYKTIAEQKETRPMLSKIQSVISSDSTLVKACSSRIAQN